MDLSKLNSLKPAESAARELLQRATVQPNDALVSLAQLYRAYVKGWAGVQISSTLRLRFQSSTVVQETLLRIQGQREDFECRSLPEFENYLLKTARAVIGDLTRHHLAQRRSLLREIPLEELESQQFWNTMRNLTERAPDEVAAEDDEQRHRLERVRVALLMIEPHYRKVIREHFESGKTIDEIAVVLDRSPNATRMLIMRALKALQAKL